MTTTAEDQSLSASASSGLAVSFTSNTTATCTIFEGKANPVGPGTCSITASQAGDGSYKAAPSLTRTFVVLSATSSTGTQSITFSQPTSLRLGDADRALSATATSGLNVTFVSNTPSTCTVVLGNVHPVDTGTCSITAYQQGSRAFLAAGNVNRTFQIIPALITQSVSFTQPSAMNATDSDQSLTISASSGLAVTLISNDTGICTIVSGAANPVSAGTCSITASQSGNSIYRAAASVTRTFIISLSSQSVSFTQPSAMTASASDQSLTASASSGLAVTLTSNNTGICTIVSGAAHAVSAGTCSITASQSGNGAYSAADSVTRTFTISKGSQSITFTQPSNISMTASDQSLTASASSGLAVTLTSNNTGICTIVSGAAHAVSAGTCSITASQSGNGAYSAADSVTRTFTIALDPIFQSITFTAPSAMTMTSADQSLTVSASSGLAVTLFSHYTSVCTIVSGAVHPVSAGTCRISASQSGNGAYDAAGPVSYSFTISKSSQSVSFTQPSAMTMTSADQTLTSSASSGLAVTLTSTTTSICTIVSGKAHPVSIGTCSITASQSGNSSYSVADSVTRTFTISKSSQSITFINPGPKLRRNGSITVNPTSNSGLSVAVTSPPSGICDVTPKVGGGFTIRFNATGRCYLGATQAGNSNWDPATKVELNFTVLP